LFLINYLIILLIVVRNGPLEPIMHTQPTSPETHGNPNGFLS
jgi:hypothetical protein